MRIQTIRIKNINSLQGEVEINLNEAPISETGLFAITGDTGSGKSTILDAITLALYGKIHRSKDVKEVISYGTAECYAEVEFQDQEDIYRAKWSLWKARGKADGKIQGPNRELAKLDVASSEFQYIASKNREVDEWVEKITGLDFNRFTRSVLLSQGDFAAFLKANEKDRSDLLERITGTEIYSEISIAAFQKNKEEQEKLNSLHQKKDALQLLDEEALDELKVEQESLNKEGDTLSESLNRYQKELHRLEQTHQLEKRLELVQQEKETLQEEKENAKSSFEKLQVHQKTLPFSETLYRLSDLETQIEDYHLAITKSKSDLIQKKEEETSALSNLESVQNEFKESVIAKTKLETVCQKVDKLDIKIQEQQLPIQQQKVELTQLNQAFQDNSNRLLGLESELENVQKTSDELQSWLKEHQNYQFYTEKAPIIQNFQHRLREILKEQLQLNHQIQDHKKLLDKNQERIETKKETLKETLEREESLQNDFKAQAPKEYILSRTELLEQLNANLQDLDVEFNQLSNLKEQTHLYADLIQKIAHLNEQYEHLIQEDFYLRKEILNAHEILSLHQNLVEYKRNIFEQQQLIANYERDRVALEEGEACPLCFSTTHPFRDANVKPFVDEAKKEYTIVQEQYAVLEQDYNQKLTYYNDISARLIHLKGNDEQGLTGQIEELELQLEDCEEKIANFFPRIKREFYEITKSAFLLQKITAFEKSITTKREARIALLALDKTLSQLEKRKTELEKEVAELEFEERQLKEKIDLYQEQYSTETRLFEATKNALNKEWNLFDLNFDTIDNAKTLFIHFQEIGSAYKHKKENYDSLSKKKALLENDISNKKIIVHKEQQTIQTKETTIAKAETELDEIKKERFELFGEKNTDTERSSLSKKLDDLEYSKSKLQNEYDSLRLAIEAFNSQIKEQEKQTQKIKTEKEKTSANLQKSIIKTGFESIERLQNSRLEQTAVENIQKLQKRIEKKEIELEQSQKDSIKQLQTLQSNIDEKFQEFTATSLTEQIETLHKEHRHIEQRKGAIKEQIKTNNKKKKEASALLKAIEKQQKESNRWAKLNDIIGQADGQKFRKFAQGLTLQKLAYLANQHLAQLNGRYQIYKPTDRDLDLDILDTFQANNIRSMNTLSGGESFLVSLALALALSSMAGRKAHIQSLFIDEGFGTLDEQTLDIAITTLDNLQAQGKTIGIISHVKELKERIAVQIKVQKRGSGISTVEVVG